jgi:hypothetical protein
MTKRQREKEERRRWIGLRITEAFVALYLVGLALLTTSCGSAIARMPYSACLYDSSRLYETGRVIAQRETDGALLFEFNDHTKGDNGFRWVTPGGNRTVARCREATLMDADDPSRRDPFAPAPAPIGAPIRDEVTR